MASFVIGSEGARRKPPDSAAFAVSRPARPMTTFEIVDTGRLRIQPDVVLPALDLSELAEARYHPEVAREWNAELPERVVGRAHRETHGLAGRWRSCGCSGTSTPER